MEPTQTESSTPSTDTSSQKTYNVICKPTSIRFSIGTESQVESGNTSFLHVYGNGVDTTNKIIKLAIIGEEKQGFASAEGLKSRGVVIKDKVGNNVDYLDNGYRGLKIPYTDITAYSTLYLSFAGQTITITVS